MAELPLEPVERFGEFRQLLCHDDVIETGDRKLVCIFAKTCVILFNNIVMM